MNATNRNPAPFAVIGLIMAFAFAILWIVAAENDPSWAFGDNKLSELGVSSIEFTADVFKCACIACGALAFVFGLGKAYCEDGCNSASGIMCAVVGIFIALIGIYNADYGNGNINETVTYLFFLFMLIAACLSVKGDWNDGKRISGAIAAILVLVALSCLVGKDIEFTEGVALICGLLWILSESVKMILEIKESKDVKIDVETI